MTRTAKAIVDLTETEEGLWLSVTHRGQNAAICLNTASRSLLVAGTFVQWAQSHFLDKAPSIERLAESVYQLATRLWFRFVDTAGGHPGVTGPSGEGDEPWNQTIGLLAGAKTALEEVQERLTAESKVTAKWLETADRIPAAKLKTAWIINSFGRVEQLSVRFDKDYAGYVVTDFACGWWPVGNAFSTEAAAMRARKT